jgi:hypothetical protein
MLCALRQLGRHLAYTLRTPSQAINTDDQALQQKYAKAREQTSTVYCTSPLGESAGKQRQEAAFAAKNQMTTAHAPGAFHAKYDMLIIVPSARCTAVRRAGRVAGVTCGVAWVTGPKLASRAGRRKQQIDLTTYDGKLEDLVIAVTAGAVCRWGQQYIAYAFQHRNNADVLLRS